MEFGATKLYFQKRSVAETNQILTLAAYNAWRVGDTKLDWYFAQQGQGTFDGAEAMGTPGAWTTNDPSHDGYQELNTQVSSGILRKTFIFALLRASEDKVHTYNAEWVPTFGWWTST